MSKIPSENTISTNYIKDQIYKFLNINDIRKWDLGASISNDSSVQVDKGIAKQIKSAQRNSLTLRVWNKKGLVGISSTSDITETGIKNALEAAHNASFYGNPNEIPQFSPKAKDTLPDIDRPICESIGSKKLFELLSNAEYELLNSHKSIHSVPYNGLSESLYERIYINSEGSNRRVKRSQSSIYLYARAEEEGKKPRSSGSVRLALGAKDLDIDGCVKEACRKTINHLDYKAIDTDQYLVCFMPEAFLELIGAFSNLFNARSIIDGVSLSNKDSIGQKIASSLINLDDDGLHPQNIGATPFDGEGTPTKKISLLENGIIKNFLHSESTARSFGVSPTGHAGMGSKVSVGPDWFVISRNEQIQPSRIKLCHKVTTQNFILIENLSALHAGVKASQGSFSLPFDGWVVENGEKISIEAATVAGDIRKVLQNIIEIEDNQIYTHSGISPHIWVDSLSVTGEA